MAKFPKIPAELTDMVHAGLVHRRGPKFIKTLDGKQAA